VLLILAGITINALTGSDSAPAKANEAEQKNDIGSAKDQISLTATNAKLAAYDTAYVGNGVSSSEASNSVGRAVIKAVAEQIQANNQVGKATIAITGYGALDNINNDAKITIKTRDFTEKGTITIEDGILTWGASKADLINDAIGNTVTYSANGVDSWRIFYADNNTQEMFLITTKTLEAHSLYGNTKAEKYTNSEDVFTAKNPASGTSYTYSNVTYGLTYNSRWAEALKGSGTTRDIDVDSNSNPTYRSKATAYLCDPTNWTAYISPSAPTGTYAVGGPTKELLAYSWEATGHQAGWQSSDVNASGYHYNKPDGLSTNTSILKTFLEYELEETSGNTTTKTKYGLYTASGNYWLASPDRSDVQRICIFTKNGTFTMSNYYYSLGLRPIVSIPLSNVQVDSATGSVSILTDAQLQQLQQQ